MRSPFEQPEIASSPLGEPQLIVGGLWGMIEVSTPQPWVEWTAEADDIENDAPTVILGRD